MFDRVKPMRLRRSRTPRHIGIGREYRRRVLFAILVGTVAVAAAFAVWESRIILLVLFAGCLGALVLATLTSWLQRRLQLPRAFAFALVLAGIAASVGLGVWLRGPALAQQFSELQTKIPDAARSAFSTLQGSGWGRWIVEQAADPAQWSRWLSYAASGIGGAMAATASTVACMALVLLSSLYLAAEPGFYMRGLRRLIAPAIMPRIEACLQSAICTLRFWLLARLVSMTAIGVIVAAGLLVLRVPLAGTLGLIAALLTFIPNLGPPLSALPAVLLAFAVSPITGLLTVLLFCVAHFIEGNFVTPLAERNIVKLPPFLTLSLQLLLAPATGVLGVALAAPILAVTLGIVRALLPPESPRPEVPDTSIGQSQTIATSLS